jgi:hypothetical protein
MRKAVIACLAFAFLALPLHAEEEKAGSGFATGLAKGAGAGGGPKEPIQGTAPDNMKSANKNSEQTKSLLLKPTKTKPVTSESEQPKDRK